MGIEAGRMKTKRGENIRAMIGALTLVTCSLHAAQFLDVTPRAPDDPPWVVDGDEVWKLLKGLAPKITLADPAGGERSRFESGTTIHHKVITWTVSGQNGSLDPGVIKDALDDKLRVTDGISTPLFDTLGGKETGFLNFTWRYEHKKSSVSGRLTVWLTEFREGRAKLLLEIDEKKGG
jgi:hypothetical protein